MKKNYFNIIIFTCLLFSVGVFGQETKPSKQQDTTADLGFYPNPASGDKIYITSKTLLEKDIFIYDVLGKLMIQATITNKELNISMLQAGVYIIKIKEGEVTATRKLIVRE